MSKKEKTSTAGWITAKKERISYYIGDNAKTLEGNLVQLFMMTFLLLSGVNLVAIATVTLVVRIFDAVNDVAFGFVIDKLKPAQVKILAKLGGQGRYLPWFRMTFWLFPLATVLLFFMPQGASDWVKVAYFAVFYVIYDIAYTLVDVPMQSAVMTITGNPAERNAIVTNRMIITVVVALISVPLMNFMISEYIGMSIRNVVLIMSIVFVSMMLPLVFVTKEHNAGEKVDEEEKYTFKDMILNVKNNKYLLMMLLSTLTFLSFASGTSITLFASFYFYNDSTILLIPMLVIIIPTIVAQKIAEKLCIRFEKYKVCIVAQAAHLAIRILLYALGYRFLILHIVIFSAMSIPSIMYSMSVQYLMLDCIEYGRFKSGGKECAGIIFALQSLILKAAAGISGSLGLFALSFFGWITVQAESFADLAEQNITQPESALNGLWFVYTGFLVIGAGLSLLCVLFYRLKSSDAKLMAKVNSGEMSREEALAQMSSTY